ncbi:MAG: helix-turn-helix transcriptional regulator [Gemmatimonas sp.]
MDAVSDQTTTIARIAAAIGEPARASMLYCLLDNRARTSTELALVAGVNPSTASAHLARLKTEGLLRQVVQGKHRFYSLVGNDVADVLEKLSVLAGATKPMFRPTTPDRLRKARTCYDHIAGTLGVQLHDQFVTRGWIVPTHEAEDAYDVTAKGSAGFLKLGVNVDAARALRRRFAFACLDWSERRSHLGGSLGAAVLHLALTKKWVVQEGDDRILRVTATGERELRARLQIVVE